jgi:sugar lactone lactonase YvrE
VTTRLRFAFALAALAACAALAPAIATARARGDARVLAIVPPPGYPASAYPHPNGNIYVGTYVNPNGSAMRSRVLEYTAAGELFRSWTVPDQDLSGDHGIQVATSDSTGRLVLLDNTPSRALLLDTRTGRFTPYATFADLPTCAPVAPTPPCSPALQDHKPFANYAAWGPDGSLYVTDYLQAVVWRVPPGGGAAQVWLADRRLDGNEFGTTGIMLAADRKTLLVAQGSSATSLLPTNPSTGKLYSVPIGADGKPGDMTQLWESSPADLPDGFGIAKSGRIYIALAGGNQIAVLNADGSEVERFSSPLFDTPSSAKFVGTRVAVPNQSYIAGDMTKMTLVDVETGESGLPELIPGPKRDVTPPRVTRVRTARKGHRVRLSYRLGEAAKVSLTLQRAKSGHWLNVRSKAGGGRKGRNVATLSLAGMKGRLCRVRVRATDPAGNAVYRVSKRFRVR